VGLVYPSYSSGPVSKEDLAIQVENRIELDETESRSAREAMKLVAECLTPFLSR